MAERINLSFIITTRNRLTLLKILLEKLIDELLPDEEIVVVDANSTDGSKEYLQQLFDAGKIHQYVSEADRNQSQGWNKALLMAKGTLIKKLIDDDVHSFTAIRACKAFMLKVSTADVCISNCLVASPTNPGQINQTGRLEQFKQWQSGAVSSFTFSDVYMMVRKSSLSFIGLYDTQFTMMDWEYALRCSFLKANIAYYTGYNSLAVDTPGNITSSASAAILKKEGEIGRIKYGYKGDRADISLFSELKIIIGKALNYKHPDRKNTVASNENFAITDITAIYDHLYNRLKEYNEVGSFEFIFSENSDKN